MEDLGTSDPEPAGAADVGQAGQAASGEIAISPVSLATGGSSTITDTTSLSGPGLRMDGGTDPGSYAVATYVVDSSATSVTAKLTVNAAPGASFTFALRGSSGGYSSRYLRIQRVPGSDALEAVSAIGPVSCGPLASGQGHDRPPDPRHEG